MENLKKSADWLMNNKKFMGYLLLAVFFIVLAQQVYNRYVKSNNNSSYYEGYSSNTSNDVEQPVATIRMFKVDWCPHCKKALPEFQSVQNEYDGKTINGYKLKLMVVDGEDPANESIVNSFKIQGYPTVVLTKDGKNIEYEAKVSKTTLQEFINTMV